MDDQRPAHLTLEKKDLVGGEYCPIKVELDDRVRSIHRVRQDGKVLRIRCIQLEDHDAFSSEAPSPAPLSHPARRLAS
ncbi:MAG: hypothetical protein JSR29_20585 [Nitrospira sp.]|nr:hypothetical protein [Nitrospira sp.]